MRQLQVVATELQSIVEQLSTSADISIFTFQIPIDEIAQRLSADAAALLQPGQIFSALRTVSTNATWVLTTLFCTFYFLRDGHTLKPKFVALAPPSLQSDIDRLIAELIPVWRAYLRGQLLLMLIIGIASGLGAAILGIRSALTIGILAGTLDFIPTIGPAIAAIIAVGIAVFEGSAWFPIPNGLVALLLFLIFGVIQTVENVWLRPQIMGNRLKLHPAVIFVAIIGAISFSGVLLALFIIPLLRTIQIVFDYLRLRIYGLNPWPEDETKRLANPSAPE